MTPFNDFMYGLSAFSNVVKIGAISVVILSVINFLLLLLVLANQSDTKSLVRQLADKINKTEEEKEPEEKEELHTIG